MALAWIMWLMSKLVVSSFSENFPVRIGLLSNSTLRVLSISACIASCFKWMKVLAMYSSARAMLSNNTGLGFSNSRWWAWVNSSSSSMLVIFLYMVVSLFKLVFCFKASKTLPAGAGKMCG